MSLPLLLLSAISTVHGIFNLYLVPTDIATSRGAACLDGTRPGFYYENSTVSGAANLSWVIFLEGGGFCASADDCVERQTAELGVLGSSSQWPTQANLQGVLSGNSSINPTFANFHRVKFRYCDGFFMAGNRNGAVPAPSGGTNMYRGRANLDAYLDYLERDFGLRTAENVLLAGCSAGGVMVFQLADYIRSRVSYASKFKAVPFSGFVLDRATLSGARITQPALESMFVEQNATITNPCVTALGAQELCLFSNATYRYSNVSFFIVNSVYDSYELNLWANVGDLKSSCILSSNATRQFWNCTADHINTLNSYRSNFMTDIQAIPKFSENGNGAFLETCWEHCGPTEKSSDYITFEINGVNVERALSLWWNSTNEPASTHMYSPCTLSVSDPHQCNPTCEYRAPYTSAPTSVPTSSPTGSTFSPTTSPVFSPTSSPATSPIFSPTSSPATSPISSPTSSPSARPGGLQGQGGKSGGADARTGVLVAAIVVPVVSVAVVAAVVYLYACKPGKQDGSAGKYGDVKVKASAIATCPSLNGSPDGVSSAQL